MTPRKGSVWQAGPHSSTWCIVGRPCTTTCCGRTGMHSVFLACQSLETASPACGKGLYGSSVKWCLCCLWSWKWAASFTSTGRPSGSLVGTTATSLRPCLCATRSNSAAHHDGSTSSVTQPWSPFRLMASAVSHNAPGWSHLNHSISTAPIWRSFKEKQSWERRWTDICQHNWSGKVLSSLHCWFVKENHFKTIIVPHYAHLWCRSKMICILRQLTVNIRFYIIFCSVAYVVCIFIIMCTSILMFCKLFLISFNHVYWSYTISISYKRRNSIYELIPTRRFILQDIAQSRVTEKTKPTQMDQCQKFNVKKSSTQQETHI